MKIVTIERKVWGSNLFVPDTKPYPQYFPEEGDANLPTTPPAELPEILHIADPSTQQPVIYTRQFWTYQNMHFTYDYPASIPASDLIIAPPAFTATCWYASSGVVPPPAGAYTSTFSIKNNLFRNDVSPVESVSPSGIWSPNAFYVSSSNSDVEIIAKRAIDGELFRFWFLPGQPHLNSHQLNVEQGQTIYPIAIYGPEEGPPFIDPEMWGKLLEWFRRHQIPPKKPPIKKDWVVDPSPIDLARLQDLSLLLRGTDASTIPNEKELEAMVKNPTAADKIKLKQGVTEIKAKIGRLEILKKDIEDALDKIK